MTENEGEYIPKSQQFERDMDSNEKQERFDSLVFSKESNTHFVTDDINELINEEDNSTLSEMIRQFLDEQKERIDILESYSEGENYTILTGARRNEKDKSDYRVRHNLGGYFSRFITGFVLGKPLTIESENKDALAEINRINQLNSIDTLNHELSYDTSRYGRAFEFHYRSGGNQDNIVIIDSDEMFVIRSADVTKRLVAAVHVPIYNGKLHPTVYTDTHKYTFKPTAYVQTVPLTDKKKQKHGYDMVPVVEWWNDRFRKGDWESQIPLMDAYDSAQSDTANYMSDLNDAMLVINGDLEASNMTATDVQKMKDANMLILETGISPDGKSMPMSAGYIYKQYDVAGTEAYKDRLMKDLFRLTNVPNLEDAEFNNGNSGVAIQRKLISLIQVASTKESFYKRALTRRYKIIEGVNKKVSADDLNFVFHFNIPEDTWEEVEKFRNAGGMVSQETLANLTSFTNFEEEETRLAKEQAPYQDDANAFYTQNRFEGDVDAE